MAELNKLTQFPNKFYKIIIMLFMASIFNNCATKLTAQKTKSENIDPKIATESRNFTSHIVKQSVDGSKAEFDTITGYKKYYYKNGKLQMEGKVTKSSPKDYRDGIWNYYNENGQLMKQETYTKESKLSQLDFMYFINGNPLSKTFQYTEGNSMDKSTYKFHKIETLFYTNGQLLSERHWINEKLIVEKCWDSNGNSKPIEFLNTIKSVETEK